MEKRKKTYSGYTEARKAANAKYNKKMARISLVLTKEQKDTIKRCAGQTGVSVNRFALQAINESASNLSRSSRNTYWVSFIISFSKDSNPCLIGLTDACMSIEEAKEKILLQRKNYDVLSAWIDTYTDKDEKVTVFHECYLNFLGDIKKLA